ncbi:class I SAM-dependent methyltransferase [Halothiobacillus sp. DCM-1]|uniref:class I SAM-dependent methyltransferase n=1 Tax=Halothiobacillus sp. DCM-1 TaxID=3112558 RepID=UPI00324584B7
MDSTSAPASQPADPVHAWQRRVVLDDSVAPAHDGQSLAEVLGIIPTSQPGADQFCLRVDGQGWALWPPAEGVWGRLPLRIDFVHDARFRSPLTLKEPLARAAGIKAGHRPPVIDLTAGLGRDAWALASMGCPVQAFERHPLIHHLLADALARARAHPATAAVAARIDLRLGTAHQWSQGSGLSDLDTVWLFDPMFPPRQKSAEVKKDMRIFAALVGADDDASAVFSWARTQQGARWLVKRPHHSTHWPAHCPDFTIESARLRFDVFLPLTGR